MKRAILAIAAVLALLGAVEGADAQRSFFDGEELHGLCKSRPIAVQGYVMGMADAFWATRHMSRQDRSFGRQICVPLDVTAETLGDIVCKYIADHPSNRHWPGKTIVWNAITEAYGTDCLQ